jgi:predicted 3-demethylubiquinone-9 3-methyltransferase (glyoxalase superfamily)
MEQKITPFSWFDGQVEEAMAFYIATFRNAKALNVSRYGEEGPTPAGDRGADQSGTKVSGGRG